MNILHLPIDVSLNIFSFLSPVEIAGSVRRTCKTWHSLSYDNSLWKVINLKNLGLHNKFSSSTFIKFLRGISDRVQRLDLGYTNLDDTAYYHGDIYCSTLQELYLFGCDISGDCVLKLMQKYPDLKAVSLTLKSTKRRSDILKQLCKLVSLRKLAIHNTDIEEYRLDVLEEFGLLFRTRNNIESLSFIHCDFPSALYNDILVNCSDLQELNIQFCGVIHRDAFDMSSVQMLRHLRTLDITDTKIDDIVLKAFADRAPNLNRISVCGSGPFVTDTGISYLAEHCTFITTLVISRSRYDSSSVTNVGLESVADNCRNLRRLGVNYCSEVSDSGVMAIARGCPGLEEFQVAGCTALSDTAVQCLVENCRGLRKLNLKECVQLTSLSVNAAVTKLKHLVYLNLETCHRIAGLDLQKAEPPGCSGKKDLIHDNKTSDNENVNSTHSQNDDIDNTRSDDRISESDKTSLTDIVQINIEDHSHIFHLYLGFCSKISVNCIRQIASYCLDLREITLQGCSYLSDISIGTLVKYCKALRRLNISGGSVNQTSRLTDKCLRLIAEYGEDLMQLVICKNHNVTVNGLFSVVTGCPRICQVSASVGERTNVTLTGLQSAAAALDSKLIRIEIFGETRVDIFVYANKGYRDGSG